MKNGAQQLATNSHEARRYIEADRRERAMAAQGGDT